VNSVTNYPGLVNNGNSAGDQGKANTIVKNIGIIADTGSSLSTNGTGWIGQYNYGINCTNSVIQNCYSTGNIGSYCGGICGSGVGSGQGGEVSIINCYSLGNIAGDHAGGISGGYSGAGGSIIVTNCYTTGAVTGADAGGILGGNSGAFYGKINVTHCYASNNICALIGGNGPDPRETIISDNTIYSGSWNTTTANSALLGLGTIWNTGATPYTLVVPPPPYVKHCLLKGTRVKTPRGYVEIEKIKVGDSIISNLNLSVKVIEVGKWICSKKSEDLVSKMYKIPAGKLGAKEDVYLSYYHRILINDRLDLPVNMGLEEVDRNKIVEEDVNRYTVYNLRVEKGENNLLVVNGGCIVESWVEI